MTLRSDNEREAEKRFFRRVFNQKAQRDKKEIEENGFKEDNRGGNGRKVVKQQKR